MGYCLSLLTANTPLPGGEPVTFFRIKTDRSGRMYLYEEERKREGGKVVSPVSRSHGRVHSFWFVLACLMDDVFRTKVNGYDPDEAERQSLEVQRREKEAADRKMWAVTHPWESETKPPAVETPAAPHHEEAESPPSGDGSEPPEGPQGAGDPE
jgi:hypothetical protein